MNKMNITFAITVILVAVGIVSEFSNFCTGLIYWTITACFGYSIYYDFTHKTDKEICNKLGYSDNYTKNAE